MTADGVAYYLAAGNSGRDSYEHNWDGYPPGLIKHVTFGAATIDDYPTNSGTIYGHANAAGAEAVGAAFYLDTPAFSGLAPVLESYSSAGGGGEDPAPTISSSPVGRTDPQETLVLTSLLSSRK